ncbi:MAG TPA: polysaccharide biosynthesis C-terminal domain-containing protein [Clostridia bacterium]|nr:polysaccharide biosynthesis C-terminal domain-containing protein [Clostridia bacterium]
MNILKDSFYLTLSKGIRSVVMMAVVMVMTRVIPIGIYGTYRQLITLSTVILAIAPLGIPISVSYYYKNIKAGQRDKLITNTLLISLLLALASSLVFTVFKYQISASLNIENIDDYLLGFSAYIFILVASSFIENLFVSAEFAKKFSICNCIYYVLFLIALIFVIYKNGRLSVIITAMSALEALRFLVLLAFILNRLKVRFSPDMGFLREQFVYCIPLGLVGIVQVLNTHLDKLIISGYFTTAEFAVYSTGAMEIPVVSLVTVSLATAALPYMSKEYNTNHDIGKALLIWGKITVTGAVLIFPVFFILAFFNMGYVSFLFSEKFLSCIPVFLIRLLRLPLSCTVFGNMLIIMGRQKVTIYNMLISIAINVAFNIILIPSMGMEGAALSGVIMHVAVILLQLYQIGRFSGQRIRDLMPYGRLLKIFLVSLTVVLPFYLLSNLVVLNYIAKFFVFGPAAFITCMYTLTKLGLADFDTGKLSLLRLRKTGSPKVLKTGRVDYGKERVD